MESPVPGGGTNKYVYRKGAFYGYADKNQKSPSWYNLSWEMTVPKLSSGLEYSDKDIVQTYTVTDLHVICDFDGKGHGKWRNLNPGTAGTISTGPIKSPTTSKIERIASSPSGALLFHLAPDAQYFARDDEFAAISKSFGINKTVNGPNRHILRGKDGQAIATVELDRQVIVAGPEGMDVKVDLPSGALEISETLDSVRTKGLKK
ncbi:MAG: hypothetical protein Q8P24_19655 [Desulfobacterales bacterium]|nr:hypothetical protein [Desulfobacterales bacterium]